MLCDYYITCFLSVKEGNRMEYRERRRLQAQETRRAILAAAVQLSRQGRFDKMTIRDI